ncbi:MAG: type II secretion system protein GspI, partial [Pseudomonadota bacterium]
VVILRDSQFSSANRFRNQTLATYIGLNVIAEIRLSGEFPKVRETSDDVEYAGRNWVWVAQVTDTDVEALRRIDVDVAFADTPDQRVHTVTGFAGQPVTGNSANNVWSGLRGETE